MAQILGIFFDQDGVIIDTERDGHRVAFNEAFAELGLAVRWDVETYRDLLRIAGGKERIRHFFRAQGEANAAGTTLEDELITRLHRRKTDIFIEMVESGALPLRPGVRRFMEEVNQAGLTLVVCTTSDERAARAVTETILKGVSIDLLLAGDVVSRKKPDPEIYTMALARTRLGARECAVIEDSQIGIQAAKAAGLFVVATPSSYTRNEDLSAADIVMSCLGDSPGETGVLLQGSLADVTPPFDGVLHLSQVMDRFGSGAV